MQEIAIFIFTRTLFLILALTLAYLFVTKIIKPKVLYPNCLTDTNACAYLNIYKYKNSFLAQVFPSEIWIWFNGHQLYVYGQTPIFCTNKNDYEPANVIQITGTNLDIKYQMMKYECITKLRGVMDYYISSLNVEPSVVYLRSDKAGNNMNVFDIFTQLVNSKIVSVENIRHS